VSRFPLPDRPHVPGRTPRPDDDLCARLVAETPAWDYGLDLIAHGFYWEAHEVLEPVWAAAAPNSRERALVQGVIHLANGALKLRMDRPKAAVRLAGLAAECVARAFTGHPDPLLGLRRAALDAAAAELAAGTCTLMHLAPADTGNKMHQNRETP